MAKHHQAFIQITECFRLSAFWAIKIFKFGEYRTIILPFVAYAGQYIMEWFDKRYLKIFDKGANKIGIDLNENKQQNDNDE